MRQATSRVRFERKVASAPKTHQKSTVREKRLITDLLPAEDRLRFFLADHGWIKAPKVFFFTNFVLFAKFCCRIGAKSCVFKRSTRKRTLFTFFSISENSRHTDIKNSMIYKKVPCFKEIRRWQYLGINLKTTTHHHYQSFDIFLDQNNVRKCARAFFRKLPDEAKNSDNNFSFLLRWKPIGWLQLKIKHGFCKR